MPAWGQFCEGPIPKPNPKIHDHDFNLTNRSYLVQLNGVTSQQAKPSCQALTLPLSLLRTKSQLLFVSSVCRQSRSRLCRHLPHQSLPPFRQHLRHHRSHRLLHHRRLYHPLVNIWSFRQAMATKLPRPERDSRTHSPSFPGFRLRHLWLGCAMSASL